MQLYLYLKKYLKILTLWVKNFGFNDLNIFLVFCFLGLYLSLLDPEAMNKFPIINPRRNNTIFSFSCLILTFS